MKAAQMLRWAPLLARPLAALQAAGEKPLALARALSTRDRVALGGALLAMCAAFDVSVVMSLHDKRRAVQQAMQASAQDIDAARNADQNQREAHEAALVQREAKVGAALAGLGAASAQSESLHFLLARTLQGLPVTVLALRALSSEELDLGMPPDNGSGIAPGSPADSAPNRALESAEALRAGPSAAAGAAPALLYRHRFELQLAGSLAALQRALETLETGSRPLRIERVRVTADAAGALQASVVLMTLAPQRTWLSL